MKIKQSNVRKIIIGESFINSIKYQKGSTYKLPLGDCTLTDLLEYKDQDQDEVIDLYLSHNGVKFLWKSLSAKMLLEIEYDSNF